MVAGPAARHHPDAAPRYASHKCFPCARSPSRHRKPFTCFTFTIVHVFVPFYTSENLLVIVHYASERTVCVHGRHHQIMPFVSCPRCMHVSCCLRFSTSLLTAVGCWSQHSLYVSACRSASSSRLQQATQKTSPASSKRCCFFVCGV